MPYLAFDFRALDAAPLIARAAGVEPDSIIGGMARMWAWCWKEKSDHVQPISVRGFFGADVSEALVAFGFLAPESGSYRVKGADRYLRIAEGRRAGGKAAAARGNLKRGTVRKPLPAVAEDFSSLTPSCSPAGSQHTSQLTSSSLPALPQSIEHRAQNIEQPPQAAAETEGVPEPEDFEPDSTGEFKPTAWGFWGWHNHERGLRHLFDEPTPPHDLKKWHDRAIAKVTIPRLVHSYLAFLADAAFAERGWPFAIFMSEKVWLPRANDPPRKQVRL